MLRGDFQEFFGDAGVTAEDIFGYTYAVLHDPEYRDEVRGRPAPRVPPRALLPRFRRTGVRMGQELLDLHIGFESAEPYRAGAPWT